MCRCPGLNLDFGADALVHCKHSGDRKKTLRHTDFWNFSKNSWAWVFSDLGTFPCIVATAARTGANGCPLSLLAIFGGRIVDARGSAVPDQHARGNEKDSQLERGRETKKSGNLKECEDERRWDVARDITKSRDAELDFASAKPRAPFDSSTHTTMAGRKTLLAPIHFIFSLLQKRSTVSVWLYEQLAFRIEGKIRVCCAHRSCMIPATNPMLQSLGIR